MMRWLTTLPRNEDAEICGVRQFFTPGAAILLEEEYEQFRTGEYRVTALESPNGMLLNDPITLLALQFLDCHGSNLDPLPTGGDFWLVQRGGKMRMVLRIPTEHEDVFLLACTCPDQRQKMVACRHCLSVNQQEDRGLFLYEQTHFMYTAAYHSHRLTLPRYGVPIVSGTHEI